MGKRKKALETEMYLCDVSRKDLCELLGITYQALYAKIIGDTQFKCDEMFAIKERLGTHKPLEELFS